MEKAFARLWLSPSGFGIAPVELSHRSYRGSACVERSETEPSARMDAASRAKQITLLEQDAEMLATITTMRDRVAQLRQRASGLDRHSPDSSSESGAES